MFLVRNSELVRGSSPPKVQTVQRALSALCSRLGVAHEAEGVRFNQRPFFRLMLCLLLEISTCEAAIEPVQFHFLSSFAHTLHVCNPTKRPAFVFAWLELVAHRIFVPKMLLCKGQRGWLLYQHLISQLFVFFEPYLRKPELTDSIRLLYKGTLRVLLVLLHDFPEFLSDNHFIFCSVIPGSCVQIRNLVLSAFPRHMKLPDPFTPNLKVDLLPEVKVQPRILSNYLSTLTTFNCRKDLDLFFRTGEQIHLKELFGKLLLPAQEAKAARTRYNLALLNAIVLFVGVQSPGKPATGGGGADSSQASLQVFVYLVRELNAEGRYYLVDACANHLRYPNALTHYYSCILLYLFAEAGKAGIEPWGESALKELITRVLLERLIVHRPHPWGLLITFVELIKNPRYRFWQHPFVTCAPEVEKLFQSVAHTCLGTLEGA